MTINTVNKLLTFFIPAAAFVLLTSPALFSAEYGLDPTYSGDTVYFNSTAKLEFIEGKTQNIQGGFSYSPGQPGSAVSGVIRVDLRTLRTGIDKRDEHMRENHLHTEDYPYAYFEIDSISSVLQLTTSDSLYHAGAFGKFFIHGVYREIEADLELMISRVSADYESITVRARFAMNLDDFKIPRPKALFLKLAETIEVAVLFTGFTNVTMESIELPDWPELD